MEYVDSEVEFVPENLDISTLRLLPGHIYMSSITDALQLTLESEVPLFFKDMTITIGLSNFRGIMEFNLHRDRGRRFFVVERVDARLSNNITFEVKQSNHPILASVFKPILVLRFRQDA
ncbi:hypothetical protein SCLCIDRAFT_24172 [Scleroderma citrinum Foug A]|uniref:Uncharacterized protein n=1 Tax=Scleroderma citrinum Foug A TaxID=1036808 RepID=A0A0C3DS90_9AGAM|nr:hypothetical protein SCLCIDRAFT_24172 [Scleroderma citrinum Foug A]